ncbi:hypothetical protein U1Q18_040819 [Sarracenia purpurea var. burkii]
MSLLKDKSMDKKSIDLFRVEKFNLKLEIRDYKATEEKVEDVSELYEEEVEADIHYEVKRASEKRTEVGEGGLPELREVVAEEVEAEEESESSTKSEEGVIFLIKKSYWFRGGLVMLPASCYGSIADRSGGIAVQT